jgi:F0F1-type ATP synthase membrane subunit c/vacuolar-type H+-ATPase subunit K
MKILQIVALALCLNMPMTHAMNNNAYPHPESQDLCKAFGIGLTAFGCVVCALAGFVFCTDNTPHRMALAAALIHGGTCVANAGFQGIDNCYK